MRTVAHGIAWFPEPTKHKIFELMRWQCSATRSAYQAIQSGKQGNDIRLHVKQNFMKTLNQRYINDACSNASQINQKHVIFGGEQAWKDMVSGKLSKQKWQDKRNNQLYSRGDKAKQGNPNIRIQDNQILINDPNNRGKWLTGSIFIPDKFQINQECYDVRVIFRNNRFEVKIGYELPEPLLQPQVPGTIGIDINPDGIALVEVDSNGNMLSHRYIEKQRIQFAKEDKRDSDIYELTKEVVDYASDCHKPIIIENLKFARKNRGKRFNRMASNFPYRKIIEAIIRRSEKEGIEIRQVNPAFTSILGLLKYKDMYSLNRHTAAAMCIARRGMGIKERQDFAVQEDSEKKVINLEGRGTKIALSLKAWQWLETMMKPKEAGLTAFALAAGP